MSLDTPDLLQSFIRDVIQGKADGGELAPHADVASLLAGVPRLSAEQFAAVSSPLEPAVVIAGAGSGKTTNMACRVVYLVQTQAVQPGEVLGLTFTNKAAAELAERIALYLPTPAGAEDDGIPAIPTVSTYHSYASSLLDEYGLLIGYEPDLRILADASRFQLAARVISRYDGPADLLSTHPPTVIRDLLNLDAQLSEHLRHPDELREWDALQRAEWATEQATKGYADRAKAIETIDKRQQLLGLVEAYRAEKTRLGLIDFGEQIEFAERVTSLHRRVGAAERERFKVVLLDEYQDTSEAQARFLGHVFGEGGHPVMAVGDRNQAIYGFRGASQAGLSAFFTHFPPADGADPAPPYQLSVSYRSDRRILSVATDVAESLYARDPQAKRLSERDHAGEGEVSVAVHHTYDDELAALPGLARDAHRAVADGQWRDILVLARDNRTVADAYQTLQEAGIPAEIVGVSGLLELPEIVEVLATLSLLVDLTDNRAMLTLLNSARWAIGPRDLALLGRRSRRLAGDHARIDEASFDEMLEAAATGVDPVDLPALCDALDDPGPAEEFPYSAEARARFAMLSGELRDLRRQVSDAPLDILRRVIDTIGIETELAAAVGDSVRARLANLDLLVRAVAAYRPLDGEPSLPALLAWLRAESEYEDGLDVAVPTDEDSVKLLTVHAAKGLEAKAVFVIGVAGSRFPSSRGVERWTTNAKVLPYALRRDRDDMPTLVGSTKKDFEAFVKDCQAHDLLEETRLAYVAFTRAKRQLHVSSHVWRADKIQPNGPSTFQVSVKQTLERLDLDVSGWLEIDAEESNPFEVQATSTPWPIDHRTPEVLRRLEVAAQVRAEMEAPSEPAGEATLSQTELELVAGWDDEIERLVDEVRASRANELLVPLPSSLSATSLSELQKDPDAFAASIARPMPRRPSSSARFGTRFHAWVETYFSASADTPLLDPDDLPGRADVDIDDDADLKLLVERFSTGQFANRAGARIEAPFALVLAGRVIRGRIDAVFKEPGPDHDWLLVDWKTNKLHTADPLQLAVYRVAWSELTGTPLERIRAGFYYVRDDRLDEPDLSGLDRRGLQSLVGPMSGRP